MVCKLTASASLKLRKPPSSADYRSELSCFCWYCLFFVFERGSLIPEANLEFTMVVESDLELLKRLGGI